MLFAARERGSRICKKKRASLKLQEHPLVIAFARRKKVLLRYGVTEDP